MEISENQKLIRMTTAPIPKLIGGLAIPTIISMLVTSIYNMADTYFVGKLGNVSATGAVGVVFSLMSIIQAFGFFCGHGSGNYISRELGKGNRKGAEKMAATGFFFALCLGTLIMVSGLIFAKPLAKLLGSTDTILPYAIRYMRIILIGAPYMCASLVLNNQLRFQGNAFYAMIGIVSGAVLNIFLDPLFILTFHMGVDGAAYATIISQLISFLLLWFGARRGDNIRIYFRNIMFTVAALKEILRGGTPSLARQGIGGIATVCLNFVAGQYGDVAVTAFSIVARFMGFLSSAVIGFGQGFQPFCGFNYGAGYYDRVKKGFWFCVRLAFWVLLVFTLIGIPFAPQIVGLFQKNDAEVARLGAIALRAQLLVLPLFSFTTLSNMMLQNLGLVVRATTIALARQGLLLIPVLFLLHFTIGLNGVLYAQTISDVLSFAVCVPVQFSVLKELNRRIKT